MQKKTFFSPCLCAYSHIKKQIVGQVAHFQANASTRSCSNLKVFFSCPKSLSHVAAAAYLPISLRAIGGRCVAGLGCQDTELATAGAAVELLFPDGSVIDERRLDDVVNDALAGLVVG